jgi:UDP-N-acetylglucosamine 2-epimerase (non-hydrolysing)
LKLCIVVGTRPEIIKMSPVIRECLRRDVDFFILHTGQHYSYNLDALFFEELALPAPKHNLLVGSGSFSFQVSKMLAGIEEVLMGEAPDYVLAEGDTNTVLATALVASHLHIPFVHIEAGLRSYNPLMQEEKNRIIADGVADALFAPTTFAREVLIREGYAGGKIFVTGNTIVDALMHYMPVAEKMTSLQKFGLQPQGYFLTTVHRAENTDCRDTLQQILTGLELVSLEHSLPVVFPIHPRTRAKVEEFELVIPGCIRLFKPVGFYDFLVLESNAALVFTDSGGVQEECCILRVPCITLREDTERPETVHVGGNLLSGTSAESITAHVKQMLSRPRSWSNPFGDGKAAAAMLKILSHSSKFSVEV